METTGPFVLAEEGARKIVEQLAPLAPKGHGIIVATLEAHGIQWPMSERRCIAANAADGKAEAAHRKGPE